LSELSLLTGIGPKRLKALEASGLRALRDLVYHLPRRYVDRTRITPISSLKEGMDAFFAADIESAYAVGTRLVLRVSDGTGDIELVFFRGLSFLRSRLQPGKRISVAGPVSYFRNFQIAHPEWQEIEPDEEIRGSILPVYPMTEEMEETRVDHKLLQRLALETLEKINFSDPLSIEERDFLKLRPEDVVLHSLHAPVSFDEIAPALNEIKVRELWPLCLNREKIKRDRIGKGKVFPTQPSVEQAVRAALPFALTQGQEQSLCQITSGLESGSQFAGLLQGDVGSGKTAVAILSALRVMAANAQAALLSPTEILAVQHFRSTAPWLEKAGLKSALLTASTPTDERTRILSELRTGTLQLLIGTHALLANDVEFKELRYILIDEQHRFGVEQRAAMASKGVEPHMLFLSATPIPRTLAQSIYGDLELITLTEKPPGRLPVKTRLVPPEKQEDMLAFLRKEVETGNQVYWVVPRIEGDDKEDVAAVESTMRRLRAPVGAPDRTPSRWRVEKVHGRLTSAERDNILTAFRKGEIGVLVATTVIEVGVDVPSANIMVVEGSDRFGLAQLHQLRGRTGRGNEQAWCFLLLPKENLPEETLWRLREFAATEDGFKIAELDLQRRGAGNLEGTRQSGYGVLRFSDFLEDAELIRALGERAGEWIRSGKA